MSSGHESVPVGEHPYFFLSYARTPKHNKEDKGDPDRLVYKLFQDICQSILDITDVHPSAVGYMDRNNQIGDVWPDELAQALATCRVFVPLYSGRYFSSENCGREWFAFRSRELTEQARMLGNRSAILPALWTPVKPEKLPPATKGLLYAHPDFGRHYAEEGFYGIMKLARYRREYQEAVYRFAQLIVNRAEQVSLGPVPPADYASLGSSFGGPGLQLGAGMQITVLALDTATLPTGRSGDYYGNTPGKWRPYRPDYPQPLAEYTVALAQCLGYEPTVGTFDEHNHEWLANGQPVPPGLCLVDPWAALSAAHRERLRRLEGLDPWVSVLVPWNSQDAELAAAERAIRQGLRRSLPGKLQSVPRGCQLAATGIPTLPEFGELLPEMAMTMLKRYRKDPSVPTYPPAGPPTERPRLRGA
jgi:FxsC-like protein